jgi:protein-S-isoprenylcysteine O-methyltransferase Ste14
MTDADPSPPDLSPPAKNLLVWLGDFFFKWRNYAFPAILTVLFLAFRPLPRAGDFDFRDGLALLLIAGGIIVRFATIGWAYIKRGGMNKQVYADTLVTSGYFGLCRNPLYVGNLMIYIGTFVLHGNSAVIGGGTVLFFVIYTCIVEAEEYFLRAKFGAEYDAYAARVPRWKPVLSRLSEVTQGMNFSLKRSITKDYSTIASTIVSVILIEMLRAWWWQDSTGFHATLWKGAIALAVLGVAAYAVRSYKLRDRNPT